MLLYPIVPVRDMVIYPGVVSPIFVTRQQSIRALEEANSRGRMVFVTAHKNAFTDAFTDSVSEEDLYKIGTLCKILQSIRLPDGTLKVVLEGGWRCRALHYITGDTFLEAELEKIRSINSSNVNHSEALRRSVFTEFELYAKLNPRLPDEIYKSVENITNPDIFADVTASHSQIKMSLKQKLLEEPDVLERLRMLLSILMNENQLLETERDIQEKVRNEMDKGQRHYYLREQLKVIHNELGDSNAMSEIDELKNKAEQSEMLEGVKEKLLREIERYSRMAPVSPEATVARTYIEWLMEMPWNNSSEDQLDIKNARKILEEEHYGLEEVKERIIEFLAVRKLAGKNMRAQVICLVGPPGVGKTSLGKSIAKTMGRKFVNMSLGGLRDEAEIRGHRRTYVGALPGRIIQKIKQAGTNNPVMLMDEIDKIGSDFRGDPSSALLEVLDPEQNFGFTDNFLEVAFDLSKVMFITTANNVSTIPKPLLDRMELISLPGYVAEEKFKIAKKHLLPRILKEHGLTADDINITDGALKNIVSVYTMEAGVRNLDRQISKVTRKIASKIAAESVAKENIRPITVNKDCLKNLLGAPKLHNTHLPKKNAVGTSIGLAWTEAGGAVLLIESAKMNGTGHLSYTGNLGDIMQESAQISMAYLRSNADKYGLSNFDWQKTDIHIHVPEGAVPKDGPSAGITLALSLCSTLTGYPINTSYAMTGEMTLHGDVLPIGGVREKLLAAKRMGITKIIFPHDNKPDVQELSDWIVKDVEIYYVSNVDEVFAMLLEKGDNE